MRDYQETYQWHTVLSEDVMTSCRTTTDWEKLHLGCERCKCMDRTQTQWHGQPLPALLVCRSHDVCCWAHACKELTRQNTHTHSVCFYRACIQTAPFRISVQLSFPTTHAHTRRQEQETLTDLLLCLGEREAAQLTHGTSFPLLLLALSPQPSFCDRQTERCAASSSPCPFLSLSSAGSLPPPPQPSHPPSKGRQTRRRRRQQKKASSSLMQPEEAKASHQMLGTSGSSLLLYFALKREGGVREREREGERQSWSVCRRQKKKIYIFLCLKCRKRRRDAYE